MINNRQTGRRRGRGNNGQRPTGSSSGGQRDSGNRIDSRARGNAAQLLEKYKNMARDAQMQGDRVNTEYYLQFADHYFRVLSDSRSRNDDPRQQQQPQQRSDSFDDDDFYGDEGEPIRAGEQLSGRDDHRQNEARRDYAPREDAQRDDTRRDYAKRDDGRDNNRDSGRNDYQPRDDQRRDSAPRDAANRDDQRREYQTRDDRPRDDRQQRDDPRRDQQPARAPARAEPNGQSYRGGPANDLETPVAAAEPARKPSTRTRTRSTRPPADAVADAAPALDADRLPPALNLAPEAEAPAEEKPKRRRGRPPATEAQAN